MKKVMCIVLLAGLAFAVCSQVDSIFEPIVGTWEATVPGVVTSTNFNSDDTYTDTNSLGSLGVTETGTPSELRPFTPGNKSWN